MTDYRERIDGLQDEHTKAELIDILGEELGERTTSVNPTTEAMFERIVPGEQPIDWARRADGYHEGLKPVAKNATALKMLLHEQIGRPLYNRVLTLKKQDFAECIVAVRAYDEGQERGQGVHVPTTLPQDVDAFVADTPKRTDIVDEPFETIAEVTDDPRRTIERRIDDDPELAGASHFVYVLDCTPPIGDEPGKLRDLRRVAVTKREAGMGYDDLRIEERAAAALNDGHRVYYVGSTSDVANRVAQHLGGTAVSGVDFTTNVPPRRLVEVQGCESLDEAEALEGRRAREIDRQNGLFAFSDEM